MTTAHGPVRGLATRPPGRRTYLSYSAVSTYLACPLRYEFKYLRDLPERTVSASLVFGAAVHRAVQFQFEELLAGNPAPDLDTLLAVYQEAWQDRDGPAVRFRGGEDANALGRLADRLLRAFRTSDFARPQGNIIGVEEELREGLIPGCPDLLGRVDLIVDAGDSLVVSDFKTSRGTWSQEEVGASAGQLLLYSELAKPLADGKPLRLQFAVLTKTKAPQLTIHPVAADPLQVERTKRVVERVWRGIQAGQFYPNPSPWNCPGCPFREPCQAWTG